MYGDKPLSRVTVAVALAPSLVNGPPRTPQASTPAGAVQAQWPRGNSRSRSGQAGAGFCTRS